MEFVGVNPILDMLRKVAVRVDGTLSTGLRRAAQPIIRSIRSDMGKHRRSGLLQKAIDLVIRSPRRGRKYVVIGAKKGVGFKGLRKKLGSKGQKAEPANYWHLVDLGVRPHALGKESQLVRRGKRRNGESQRGAMHPGFEGERSLERAFRSNRWAVSKILREHLQKALAEAGFKKAS